jgi:CheY-like chemotaxis protein
MKAFSDALVVDHSSVARQLISRYLKTWCRVSDAVGSVAEANARLERGELSLVVLDAALEGAMPWFERCSLRTPRPAFVIVANRPFQDEETRCTMLGAIGYLAKPVSYAQLAHALACSSDLFDPAPVWSFPVAEAFPAR